MRLLKLLIIPLLLILGYFTLVSYPYFFSKISRYNSLGFLSLVEEKSVNIQRTLSPERRTDQFDNHLFKGEKITAKFTASENNFGIVLFRFAKLSNKVSDTVVFRIKKEGDEKWYYGNKYNANQFQDNQYFTFGFPPFLNSKNNVYVFEIESLKGNGKNGIGVSLDEPKVALVYKYSRNDLKNYNTLSSFIFKKFVYVVRNVNFLQDGRLLAIFVLPFLLILLTDKMNISVSRFVRFLPKLKKNIIKFSKKTTPWFNSTIFYSVLNTNTKKRIAIGLLLFLFALTYRFSSALVNHDKLFYAGLGGQGDYDQFIRAATCAVRSFCSYAILGQNFLFETIILGIFYEIFGFVVGLKAYLFLMIILSSIVATIPHFLLARKGWISLGGIIAALFLSTSDFLTWVSLNFTPDNGSLFTFSIFYLVYFVTLHRGTFRWLLFFGFWGTIDGLNKALFLLNDPAALALFAPGFFVEKAKKINKFPFFRFNAKLLFYSFVPLLLFIILYTSWEIFIYAKFSSYYWLRGLFASGGKSYIYYTTSYDNSFLVGNVLFKFFYLILSAIVMIKRLLDYTDFQIIFLAPISLVLLFTSFRKTTFSVKKSILIVIFSIILIALLISTKNDYFKIQEIFAGEFISQSWTNQTYIGIFLFSEIIFLFIINFQFQALKLSVPILPYVIMLIILTKNSPFPRISTQVVAWVIILFGYLFDCLLTNTYSRKNVRILLGTVFLILFIFVYLLPRTTTMIMQLRTGIAAKQSEIKYLRWVGNSLPANSIILAGGKSDLVTVGENIKRPIVYSTLWSTALLIKPNKIPGISPSDFSLITELKNKKNFERNKYIILEDDIYLWRARVTGVADGIFSANPNASNSLHANDYSIKVYKSNPMLKKAIYELQIKG